MSEYGFSRLRIFLVRTEYACQRKPVFWQILHCDTTVLGKIEINGNICPNWFKALSFPADILIPSCMPRTDCA